MRLSPDGHIVILTGAGISKESGLDTFRDVGGIWQRYDLEAVCTPEGFARDPDLVHDFYNQRRRQLLEPGIKPNAAHIALAALQHEWSGEVTLVTQNIDNLHERGGSLDVVHMHGELLRLWCVSCGEKFASTDDSASMMGCPSCGHSGAMRPDIVWFGEMPYHMARIEEALADADLFVAIGTSGMIYPAAGFCNIARHHGALTVEVNLEESQNAVYFGRGFYGPATEQVPLLVSKILEKREI